MNGLHGALVGVGEAGACGASVGRGTSLISNQAAAAIDLIELLEENVRLALHDGLTGLLNRRAFDEALERAVSQAARGGQALWGGGWVAVCGQETWVICGGGGAVADRREERDQ